MRDVEIGALFHQKIYMSFAELKEIANKAVFGRKSCFAPGVGRNQANSY